MNCVCEEEGCLRGQGQTPRELMPTIPERLHEKLCGEGFCSCTGMILLTINTCWGCSKGEGAEGSWYLNPSINNVLKPQQKEDSC